MLYFLRTIPSGFGGLGRWGIFTYPRGVAGYAVLKIKITNSCEMLKKGKHKICLLTTSTKVRREKLCFARKRVPWLTITILDMSVLTKHRNLQHCLAAAIPKLLTQPQQQWPHRLHNLLGQVLTATEYSQNSSTPFFLINESSCILHFLQHSSNTC